MASYYLMKYTKLSQPQNKTLFLSTHKNDLPRIPGSFNSFPNSVGRLFLILFALTFVTSVHFAGGGKNCIYNYILEMSN